MMSHGAGVAFLMARARGASAQREHDLTVEQKAEEHACAAFAIEAAQRKQAAEAELGSNVAGLAFSTYHFGCFVHGKLTEAEKSPIRKMTDQALFGRHGLQAMVQGVLGDRVDKESESVQRQQENVGLAQDEVSRAQEDAEDSGRGFASVLELADVLSRA